MPKGMGYGHDVAKGGGQGSMSYNDGVQAGDPGEGKTTKHGGNVYMTRLPNGGSHKMKGKKGSKGMKYD